MNISKNITLVQNLISQLEAMLEGNNSIVTEIVGTPYSRLWALENATTAAKRDGIKASYDFDIRGVAAELVSNITIQNIATEESIVKLQLAQLFASFASRSI